MSKKGSSNGREPPPEDYPHPLIRGVTSLANEQIERKQTTWTLDWLQYSLPWPEQYLACAERGFLPNEARQMARSAFLDDEALEFTGEQPQSFRGYDTGLELTYGRVFYHRTRPEQKISVQFRGADLAGLVDQGVDHCDLLEYAIQVGAKITRLDYAIDYHVDVDVMDIWRAWESGDLQTSVRKASRVEGLEVGEPTGGQGQTVYLGGQSSYKRLCIYNKAAERGVPGPWTRIELRAYNDYAQRLAEAMLEYGIGKAGCAGILSVVQGGVDWLMDAIDQGDEVYIGSVGRKDTNTVLWLEEDVLPILRRELKKALQGDDWRLYDAYQHTLGEVVKDARANGVGPRKPEHLPNRRDDGSRLLT